MPLLPCRCAAHMCLLFLPPASLRHAAVPRQLTHQSLAAWTCTHAGADCARSAGCMHAPNAPTLNGLGAGSVVWYRVPPSVDSHLRCESMSAFSIALVAMPGRIEPARGVAVLQLHRGQALLSVTHSSHSLHISCRPDERRVRATSNNARMRPGAPLRSHLSVATGLEAATTSTWSPWPRMQSYAAS